MIHEEILALLRERYGSLVGDGTYYSRIAEWEAWWKGHERSFHEYAEAAAAGVTVRRQLYRLNMAKKVCEDWASLLLNDRTVIRIDDEQGDSFVKQTLRRTGFAAQANRLVEKAFATGTGAAILRFCAESDENGQWSNPDDPAFEFVDAAHIVPLSIRDGRITEAAFLSDGWFRGQPYTYLETHTLEEDGYIVRNEFFTSDECGRLIPLAGMPCAAEVRTGSRIPLFAILTPNLQNPIDDGCGLGVSVFHAATDCLKGVDLAFNNFCRDIKLGGKKVFISQSLIQRDESGTAFTPDDVAQQLFVTLGDADFSDHPMISEHNPELRADENAQAVQCQLNYLSFRCGLGAHHYSFGETDGRARLTATQYMGERQDMRQNAVKHQKNVEQFLIDTVRALLWCGQAVFGLAINPDAEIHIDFDDSYFQDTESLRSRDLREVEAGVLTPDEYRRKWIGGGDNA